METVAVCIRLVVSTGWNDAWRYETHQEAEPDL